MGARAHVGLLLARGSSSVSACVQEAVNYRGLPILSGSRTLSGRLGRPNSKRRVVQQLSLSPCAGAMGRTSPRLGATGGSDGVCFIGRRRVIISDPSGARPCPRWYSFARAETFAHHMRRRRGDLSSPLAAPVETFEKGPLRVRATRAPEGAPI